MRFHRTRISSNGRPIDKIEDSIIYKLQNTIREQLKKISYIEEENENIIQRIDKAKKAQIIVDYTIHANVMVSCMKEVYLTNEMKHVSIKYDGAHFSVNNLQIGYRS